jgi:hypothetical protein
MARISKYINEYTSKSEELIQKFSNENEVFSLQFLEDKQQKFGISNVLLCDALKISITVLSKWKNGVTELPDYYKISIYSFLKYLEDNHK